LRFASDLTYRWVPSSRRTRVALSLLVTAAISAGACSNSEETSSLGMRRWGQYEVAVETRPSPPREGHNEVVVIISGEHHRPVYDALVSLRTQASAPWVQAIEDGHVGVYRRAVNFGHGANATLQVQLQRGDEQMVLDFPVAIEAQP
jgi:hypothetical protein